MAARTIVYIAWGQHHVECVARCVRESRLPRYPIVLVTDPVSAVDALPRGVSVIRKDFRLRGKERKLEALASLPSDLETVLFLDADTRVLDDISLGFDKAEQHGIAMAPAPHYSLADFRAFGEVMRNEGVVPRGQLIYNSGVAFFAWNRREVRDIFEHALALAAKYTSEPYGDQPYITLAMETAGFNPYTLSPSFNHRAFGELISGSVRVWHSTEPVPPNAAHLERGWLYRHERGEFVRHMRVPL